MIVARKMANRCHAFSSTPAGIGKNQMITATRTVTMPRTTDFSLDSALSDWIALDMVALPGFPIAAGGYCLWGVDPGAEPPLNNSRPSGKVMDRPLATDPPTLARKPVISTSSPVGIVSFFQPSLNSEFGAPSSNRQLTTLPSG